MFTATTITCLRQRGSAPHPGATAPTIRAGPGSNCWPNTRIAAHAPTPPPTRTAPHLHLKNLTCDPGK